MGKINVLDKLVADMIAAGEVVERPASVVKELVENSIDSGATLITVEIRNGGTSYIRVTDNGSGILREDIETAFKRHATSKIKTKEDLTQILTLGFRGEALSSISAVSKVELITRTSADISGTRAVVEAGNIVSFDDAGCPEGTTLIVRDIFYNIPARKKFLKSDKTEAAYISDIIDKLIFSHPEISIRFISNGNEMAYSSGDNNLRSCAYTVFGKEISAEMIDVNFENEGIKITGLTGSNSVTRGNRAFQCFFVNGRYVKGALFSRSVEESYFEKIGKGRFPVCILKIELPPDRVDINVHPTKLEAKFVDEAQISRSLYFAINNALMKREKAVEVKETPKNVFKYATSYASENSFKQENIFSGASTLKADKTKPKYEVNVEEVLLKNSNIVKPYIDENSEVEEQKTGENKTGSHIINKPIAQPVLQLQPQVNSVLFADSKLTSYKTDISQKKPENLNNEIKPDEIFKIIGQLFETYILIEKGNELLVIDQHAAHERQRYDELIKKMNERDTVSQVLLTPVIVTLSKNEKNKVLDNIEFYSGLGFEIEDFGNNEIIVRTTPEILGDEELKSLVVELIDKTNTSKNFKNSDINKEAIYQIACKSAIKANRKLSAAEMERITDYVMNLGENNTCPHGRPIVLSFSKYFIEKQFKRT